MNDRSLFQALKDVVNNIADATGTVTSAVNSTAQIADSLAQAGVTMAESNRKLVTIQTKGKMAREISKLKEEFDDLELAELEEYK